MFEPVNEKAERSDQEENIYQTPAIVYEGVLTTRAGSTFGAPPGDPVRSDPSDLFNTSP